MNESRSKPAFDRAEKSEADCPAAGQDVAAIVRASIRGQLVACLAALLGAWLAAGSTGLMAHPLRRALLWIVLGIVLLFASPLGSLALRNSLAEEALPRQLAAARRRRLTALGCAVLGIVVAVWLAAAELPAVTCMAPGVLLVALAVGTPEPQRRTFVTVGAALAVFAVYRATYASAAIGWIVANHLGQRLGELAAAITGWPLCIGATMAGLDFLVPMLCLAVLLPLRVGKPLGRRLPAAVQVFVLVLLVLLAHFVYLLLLSSTGAVLERYPQLRPGSLSPDAVAKLSSLERWLRELLIWNFPATAAVVHSLLAGLMLWLALRSNNQAIAAGSQAATIAGQQTPIGGVGDDRIDSPLVSLALGRLAEQSSDATVSGANHIATRWLTLAMVLVAVLFAAVGNLSWHRPEVQGKKVVIYQEGFLNWLRPEHGQYGRLSIGMYGMLPSFLRSYGIQVLVSENLSEEDLAGAQAVVLIYPNKPWQKGQLRRLWQFVRAGGSLLVLGEHTVDEAPEEGGGARFNDVLRPTSVRVAFDSATFAIGGWLHSYDTVSHPTTAGIGDQQNEFGVVIGASLGCADYKPSADNKLAMTKGAEHAPPDGQASAEAQADSVQADTAAAHSDSDCEPGIDCPVEPAVARLGTLRWPARPILVGRWGWADPGDPEAGASKMGNHLYDPGERLGDLVLAAEEPLGKGRVVVFGDTSLMSNGLTINCHEYVSRLMAYLVDAGGWTQAGWRQVCCVLAAAALAALVLWCPAVWPMLTATVALAIALVVSTVLSWRNWEITPDCKSLAELSRDAPENRPSGDREAQESTGEAGESWIGKRPAPDPPRKLAYVDAAHLNRYSFESWREDGTAGLFLTLMRNGYLTLSLSRLTEERLLQRIAPEEAPTDIKPPRPDEPEDEDISLARQELKRWRIKAQMYVVIAPDRPFSAQERETVKRFVRCGGVLIWTVGYEDIAPSRQMLGEFGFRVGQLQRYEGTLGPPPMWRYFKLPYLYYPDGRARNFVRFHCGWPVECDCPEHRMKVIAAHPDDGPMIVVRNYGRGRVAVIGDSGFALNKNLEREDGGPFDLMYENADFWRWFIAALEDAPPWIPPVPKPVQRPPAAEQPPELLQLEQQPPPDGPRPPAMPEPMDQPPSGPLLLPPDSSPVPSDSSLLPPNAAVPPERSAAGQTAGSGQRTEQVARGDEEPQP